MYKNELENHIKKGSVSNSIVLFGESSFFIDRYTKILTNIEDSSTLNLSYDEYDFKIAKAHLSQASLFGGNNVLIIKSEKKVPKKELESLVELCEKDKNNLFVYAYYGSDHKIYSKGFSKKSTMSVRFFNPKDWEAQNIMEEIAKSKNIKIDRYSLLMILKIHNFDLALSCNELEKLQLYDKEITTKDIENLVSGLGEINIDELIKKILDKKDFKDDLQNILDHGTDEIRIITSITSYLTQLYMFLIYIKVHGAPNALEILGYPAPKFVVDEKAKLSLKFKPTTYYNLHNLLLETELKMKSAHCDKTALLLSSLIKIQKLI